MTKDPATSGSAAPRRHRDSRQTTRATAPRSATAWSDEAEAVLRTEVAGQRFKFATCTGAARRRRSARDGLRAHAQEARSGTTCDREVSLLGAARSRPFWRRRLARRGRPRRRSQRCKASARGSKGNIRHLAAS